MAEAVAPERRLNDLDDRVWRGVVANDHFCREGEFFVYARGRGIYANFIHLGPDRHGVSRTHWGFFNEEDLPADRGEQRRLLNTTLEEATATGNGVSACSDAIVRRQHGALDRQLAPVVGPVGR